MLGGANGVKCVDRTHEENDGTGLDGEVFLIKKKKRQHPTFSEKALNQEQSLPWFTIRMKFNKKRRLFLVRLEM